MISSDSRIRLEQSVIGAWLLGRNFDLLTRVPEEGFWENDHHLLTHQAIVYDCGWSPEEASVTKVIDNIGKIDPEGRRAGEGFVWDLVESGVHTHEADKAFAVLLDEHAKRSIRSLAKELSEDSKNGLTPKSLLENYAKRIEALSKSLEDKGESTNFKTLTDALNAVVPPRLCGDLMRRGEVGTLVGPPGCGKSFVALSIALSLANGDPEWFGHKLPSAQHQVLYVFGEGQGGINQRIRAHFVGSIEGEALEVLTAARNFHYMDRPVRVLEPTEREQFREDLRYLTAKHNPGIPLGLVILDTLNRCLVGGSENDDSDMGVFNAFATELSEEFGCVVLIVHHTGKDTTRGARGHSSLLGAVHFEIIAKKGAATRCDQTDIIRTSVEISSSKAKDTENFKPMVFSLVSVDTGLRDPETGEAITSATLEMSGQDVRLGSGHLPDGERLCHSLADIIRTFPGGSECEVSDLYSIIPDGGMTEVENAKRRIRRAVTTMVDDSCLERTGKRSVKLTPRALMKYPGGNKGSQ